jgi:CRP-like cAMP-binding protein
MIFVMSTLAASFRSPQPAGDPLQATLAPLTPRARAALLELARRVGFAAGATILEEGRRAESFYLVTAGQVKMCRPTPAGRTLILSLFGPGDAFGVTPVLSGEPCPASWEAVTDVHGLEVRRTDLFALFARQPMLVPELLPWLTRQLMECRNCLVETSCARVDARFASLFLGFVARMGEAAEDGWKVALPLSRQELADLTGTTLETAIRVMSRWSKEGLVSTRRDGFVVHDRRALESLAIE